MRKSSTARALVRLVSISLLMSSGCGVTLSPSSSARDTGISSLTISTPEVSLVDGETGAVRAIAVYKDGTMQDVTASARWMSHAPDVATVSASGIVTCASIGATPISASLDEAVAAASVSCTPSVTTLTQHAYSTVGDEFVGPFAAWVDVKKECGAVGDGVADDTQALQCGLDKIDMTKSDRAVLWVPAGTYRITGTLSLIDQIGLAVIGEDPNTTRIVWDGPSGETMLSMWGDKFTRISRLTWDGAGLADTGQRIDWDGVSKYYGKWAAFPTNNLESDEIFTGLNAGIRIGYAGETSIERVRFVQMQYAGISTENGNALDVWVRDSYFDHCVRGLITTNEGHFQVYSSAFLHSTVADMVANFSVYFSERNNISIDSKAFLVVPGSGANTTQITIEGNIIVDPTSSPFVMGFDSPMMLFGNTVILPSGAPYPIVKGSDWSPYSTNVLSLDNTYSGTLTGGNIGQVIQMGDKAARRSDFAIVTPQPAPFRPNFHRTVFEISAGADTDSIQRAVNRAVATGGDHPVVHFASGTYNIIRTLEVPGASTVQLVGEGDYSTWLNWKGDVAGPLIHFANPARATMRDLELLPASGSDGIAVEVNDTPGSRVLMSNVVAGAETGLLSDQLDNTVTELRGTSIQGSETGVRVVGGANASSGSRAFGRVSLFGAGNEWAGESNYQVVDGGTLTVEDTWRDGGGVGPIYTKLSGSGHVFIQGGLVDTSGETPLQIDGFAGDVTVSGVKISGNIGISGDNTPLKFLGLANASVSHPDQIENDSEQSSQSDNLIGMALNSGFSGNGVADVSANASFIAGMLRPYTYLSPDPILKTADDLTDLRLERVYIDGGLNAVHLYPAAGMPTSAAQGFELRGDGGTLLPMDAGIGNSTIADTSAGGDYTWNISPTQDGFYEIRDASGSAALDSDLLLRSSTDSSGQKWTISRIGDGTFRICNIANSFCLTSTSQGATLTLSGLPQQGWQIIPR